MTDTAEPFLIAGLGNPGVRYRRNRHNVGFLLLDQLAETAGIRLSRMQMKAIIGSGVYAGAKVLLAKPQSMMNRSGLAIASLVRYYRIELENLYVVYDDLDLLHGQLRLKPAGGSGGHRGLSSIIRELGSDRFPRLRIGIGRPPGRLDPADYVLQDFNSEELESMQITLQEAQVCLSDAIRHGIQAAMTNCNQRDTEDE